MTTAELVHEAFVSIGLPVALPDWHWSRSLWVEREGFFLFVVVGAETMLDYEAGRIRLGFDWTSDLPAGGKQMQNTVISELLAGRGIKLDAHELEGYLTQAFSQISKEAKGGGTKASG